MSDLTPAPDSRIDIFNAPDGGISVKVHVENQTVWLTQRSMAELYQTTPQNIGMHLKAIYGDGELDDAATCKEYLQVRSEGNREIRRSLKHYSLDAIISVGYRVRSSVGTQFRRWATERLREYMVKGFTMDDERLKNPGGWDYFDELLERIRTIRASEKRFFHALYLPHSDLWRTDAHFASLLKAQKIPFHERIIPKLKDLPKRIEELLAKDV